MARDLREIGQGGECHATVAETPAVSRRDLPDIVIALLIVAVAASVAVLFLGTQTDTILTTSSGAL